MAKIKEVRQGDVFGQLVVVCEVAPHVYPNGAKRRKFKLKCSCGKETEANINNLRSGTTTSCGCFAQARKVKHGMYKTRQYQCWADMKTRCDNPSNEWYEDYGGRGITYPEKWKTFAGFWEDMAEGYMDHLTLNRIDNDSSYSKENCAWDEVSDQNHNRRKRANSWLSVIGGVFDRRDSKMYARIKNPMETTSIHLGWYLTEDEVAEAYDMASEILYGDRPNKTKHTRESVAVQVEMYLARRGIVLKGFPE